MIYAEFGSDFFQRNGPWIKIHISTPSLHLRTAIKTRDSAYYRKRSLCMTAGSHRAKWIATLLEVFRWDLFQHPAYSSDLAPNDYHLISRPKKELGATFATREELFWRVTEILSNSGEEFYREGIDNLNTRYEKCRDQVTVLHYLYAGVFKYDSVL